MKIDVGGAFVVCACLGLLAGCTPPRELIQKMMAAPLEECKNGEGDFAPMEMVDGTIEQVLVSACAKPIEQIDIEDKIKATAKMGPYTWRFNTDPSSGVWKVTGIEWRELTEGKKILEDEDADANTYKKGLEDFAKAQEQYPEGTWVRLARLEMMLKLQKKTRNKLEGEALAGIGADAEKQLAETIEWAKEKPVASARARLLVIDYINEYRNFLDMALETQGAGDEHLENSAKLAEKEGRPEEAAKYRKELEDVIARREKETVEIKDRQTKLLARVCSELSALAPERIDRADIKDQVVALKKGTKCAP